MTWAVSEQFGGSLSQLGPPGVRIGHRMVDLENDALLLPAEEGGFAQALPDVRRRAAAARSLARELLSKAGHGPIAFPRSMGRPPGWPPGIVGSMSHAPAIAVAAIAGSGLLAGIGIDIEPACDLPDDLAGVLRSPAELVRGNAVPAVTLFTVKEAVFKAITLLTGMHPEFADIDVDFECRTAAVAARIVVEFDYLSLDHVVALAWVRAGRSAMA